MIDFHVPEKAFFAVKRLLDDATIGPMNRIGGFIRLTAARSMRNKRYPQTAAAGEPPYSHLGLIKRLMAYSYDPSAGSLIAGPMAINTPSDSGEFTVPQLLEFGGRHRIREKRTFFALPKGTTKVKKKKGRIQNTVRVTLKEGTYVEYPPHPFMGPALEKAMQADKLRQAWSIVGGGARVSD